MCKKNVCLFTTITLVVMLCFMLSGSLYAICSGWTIQVDGDGTVRYYDETGKLKYKAWLDEYGKFHEKHYSIVQKSTQDPFGDIQMDNTNLNIPVNVDAANLVVYEMYSGNTVWEHNGPITAGEELNIPLSTFSEKLHMIATLDSDGYLTNSAIFKIGNNCTGSIIGQ